MCILKGRAVDLRHVDLSTTKGIVYISGWLVYKRSLKPLSSVEIFNIEKKIKGIPEVERVNFRLNAERLAVETPKPGQPEEKKQSKSSYKADLKPAAEEKK